ncbi:DNA polymerase III subunit gamma/tau [Microbacterium sp. NPDC096154]|uniref:DNA polymerase III subunit gamma/tau n=1 Tax=Microbacterium sp. NPDC096154 TaxID=3155549 RepID=UPI003327D2D8
MASGDDDALTWDGDDDPTLDERADSRAGDAPAGALPRGWRPVGRGSRSVATQDDATRDDAPQHDPGPDDATRAGGAAREDASGDGAGSLGNVALVTFGVLAGVYALYIVGWVLAGSRVRDHVTGGVGVADAMSEAALWLAALAPAIWFGVTLYATRGKPTWRRVVGLVLGVLLLVPWPFVMLGAVGQ